MTNTNVYFLKGKNKIKLHYFRNVVIYSLNLHINQFNKSEAQSIYNEIDKTQYFLITLIFTLLSSFKQNWIPNWKCKILKFPPNKFLKCKSQRYSKYLRKRRLKLSMIYRFPEHLLSSIYLPQPTKRTKLNCRVTCFVYQTYQKGAVIFLFYFIV